MFKKRNSIILEETERLLNKIIGILNSDDSNESDELYDMCLDISYRIIEITSEIKNLSDAIEYIDDKTLRQKRERYLKNIKIEKTALEILEYIYSERAEMMEEDMKQNKEQENED